MPRLVLDPGAALCLLRGRAVPAPGVALLAPTLLRDQVLGRLYAAARAGELAPAEAQARHEHLSRIKIRYLGDKVLRRTTWRVAEEADAASSHPAAYIALTMLQGDALVALDDDVRIVADGRVALAPFAALAGPA